MEAGLCWCSGWWAPTSAAFGWLLVRATVFLLCFIMGLQNAIVTKYRKGNPHDAHDGHRHGPGIELGASFTGTERATSTTSTSCRPIATAFIDASILGLFFVGGIVGALAFKSMGFSETIPDRVCCWWP